MNVKKTEKKKILIKGTLGYNGIAQVVMNYCMALKNENDYDFIVTDAPDATREDYKKTCRENGWNIYYLPSPVKHFFSYFKQVKKIIKSNQYDTYHINGNSGVMLFDVVAGKSTKIKTIVHSHNSSCKFKLLHKLCKPFLKKCKAEKLACSDLAGKWVYGKSEYTVLNNCIDYNRFSFDERKRNELRKALRIDTDTFMVLQVGNLQEEKNQGYTLHFFASFLQECPNAVLVFCGGGPDKEKLEQQITSLGLQQKVRFAGKVPNVNEYYIAADVLVQPSVYEGLPLTLLEGQAADLLCLASSNITRQCEVSENVTFLGIAPSDCEKWVEALLRCKKEKKPRRQVSDEWLNGSFDINRQAQILQKIYE